MRVYADSSDTVMVRWFKAKDDAKSFPVPHAFGSHVWDGEYVQPFQGPGEFLRQTQWEPNANFGCDGQVAPADLKRFQRGLLPSDGPLPKCCGTHWLFGAGGVLIDGGALFNFCPHICSTGGVRIGGTGFGQIVGIFYGDGGIEGDSNAYDGSTPSYFGDGGVSVGGTAY